jgi:DNA polymerase III alpha subunit (gram-positive type)
MTRPKIDEIYVSVDVETDGPIPGPNSMLSIGAAAFMPSGEMISTFSGNLETLPDASGDPDTMKWWTTQASAWEAHRKNIRPPQEVMSNFISWVKSVAGPSKPVFVGYPAGFDFLFVYWYLIKFCKHSPFSFSALDIKTYASAVLKCGYRSVTKGSMPDRWFGKSPHTHEALDDAIEQGELFCNMLREHLSSNEEK